MNRQQDQDEVVASRASDIALLRLVEEAKRRGLAKEALALVEHARAAEHRHRGALGVTVRRRPQ